MRLNPRYFFMEALISLRRNWLMSVAAISTVAILLFIVGLFSFLIYNARAVIEAIERQVEISVYLKDDLSPPARDALEEEIRSWEEVRSVKYISKEQALEIFIETVGEDSDIVKGLSGNPLPASFEISLKDPKTVETVANRFLQENGDHREGVDDLRYGQEYVRKLFSITTVLGIIIGLVILLLFFSALILIYNTIRLAIYARRKEVEVMRLVGASNWFITWPFILEGIIEGVAGGAIAILLVWMTNSFLLIPVEEVIVSALHIRTLALTGSEPIQLQVFTMILVVGASIGAVGSGVALRRFLRV
ncbi:cell division transport system permease protein [Candidatus Hakubella thermalkaliphila]|uniref:Cell division protein FtsX n=4 Tax=Candidatus Hakubella thermalkaliphila TaxID=2754717 RepID=A0A6V8NY37_9ACTN|nr:permease-like cell division protein FtsX [Candidatus Hakubella thermalkaliphila]GFP25175.1 cell division transport system permease protein [Candidatus Hakubella thermalkaliphila]GFP31950.1 cell division transport system permease protein [Candidatus Hakubella thermalkaliphila]GFP35200.1 cell division transport system permease protein [Candidatus Hakubella thermalkaliphila]